MEIGAGAGSIAAWLAQAVGNEGSVLATDLDTKFLGELDLPNLRIGQHDITRDPLPQASFDLIHSRALIHLLPERERVLETLARALKPGGWLICEVFDHFLLTYPEDEPIRDAVWKFLETSGVAGSWGRQLPALFQQLAFTDVRANGHVQIFNGGSAAAELWALTWLQFRDRLLDGKFLSVEQLEKGLAELSDPTYWAMAPLMVAVRGRCPSLR
ncbi:MAG TPA: class I SAM-dependent methyltransferase [Blastocatellia bacterium]